MACKGRLVNTEELPSVTEWRQPNEYNSKSHRAASRLGAGEQFKPERPVHKIADGSSSRLNQDSVAAHDEADFESDTKLVDEATSGFEQPGDRPGKVTGEDSSIVVGSDSRRMQHFRPKEVTRCRLSKKYPNAEIDDQRNSKDTRPRNDKPRQKNRNWEANSSGSWANEMNLDSVTSNSLLSTDEHPDGREVRVTAEDLRDVGIEGQALCEEQQRPSASFPLEEPAASRKASVTDVDSEGFEAAVANNLDDESEDVKSRKSDPHNDGTQRGVEHPDGREVDRQEVNRLLAQLHREATVREKNQSNDSQEDEHQNGREGFEPSA